MISAMKKWLWPEPDLSLLEKPVTHKDVVPERLDPERERQADAARERLAGSIAMAEWKSIQIREALAGGVLDIITGRDR
jgi:hypothetical protein